MNNNSNTLKKIGIFLAVYSIWFILEFVLLYIGSGVILYLTHNYSQPDYLKIRVLGCTLILISCLFAKILFKKHKTIAYAILSVQLFPVLFALILDLSINH